MRAVRILVPDVADCYTVLGIVHSRSRHVPDEFDDYIANPKKNGYQSLHTAVMGPENKVLEIQIRTFAMHDEAELGVCAHFGGIKGMIPTPKAVVMKKRLPGCAKCLSGRMKWVACAVPA